MSAISLEPYVRSITRAVVGFLFCLHGFQKLFGLFGGIGGTGAKAELVSLMGVAGTLETFGGLLIAVGLFTRPTAFLLSGQMAVAYFQVHARRGALPIANGGELAVLYCFVFLWFSVIGPGPWSLDRAVRRRA